MADIRVELQEIKEEVDSGTAISAEEMPRGARRGRSWLWAAAALLMAGIASVAWWQLTREREMPPPTEIDSIAVLPFQNVSGDPEEEYFVDGVTEAVITDLAKIRGLKVISRTSAMRYKGTDKPLAQVARELGVKAVVEGSALLAGERVRISADLIDAATDTHLWAESYERPLEDILALHAEVARAIAEQIQVAVSPEEARQLARSPRVNPEAYRLYLQGNYHFDKTTPESIEMAQSYFQRTIQADPEFAPAHAGLALVLTELGTWEGYLPPGAVHVPAKAAAQKALELDPALAEGHIALARIKELFEWDWAGADTAFRQGIQLGPSSPHARSYFAQYLVAVGRFEESVTISNQTLKIDPLSPIAHIHLGLALHLGGRDREALDVYRKTLELGPDLRSARWLRALLYLNKGMIGESMADVDGQTKLVGYGGPAYRLGQLGYLYGRTGRRREALRALSELQKRGTTDYVPASAIGMIYLGLDRREEALDELERAFAERDVYLVFLKVLPIYADIRSHPRFQALLRRMNFPE